MILQQVHCIITYLAVDPTLLINIFSSAVETSQLYFFNISQSLNLCALMFKTEDDSYLQAESFSVNDIVNMLIKNVKKKA